MSCNHGSMNERQKMEVKQEVVRLGSDKKGKERSPDRR